MKIASPKKIKRSSFGTEPVSLSELKAWVDQESADHDTLLAGILAAARTAVENHLSRALIECTVTAYLDDWPSAAISLPYPPVDAVTSLKYQDIDDSQQTVSNTLYTLSKDVDDRAHLVFKPAFTYPTLSSWMLNPVEMVYTVASPTVPEEAKLAIKWVGSLMYENPDASKINTPIITRPVENLLANIAL